MSDRELLSAVLETQKLILHRIERLEKEIMSTRVDLNTAIAAVPAAVVAALPPGTTALDFTPEITALGTIPAQVVQLLAAATPPPAPAS